MPEIHFAFHSAGSRIPICQKAGALHAEAFPSLSQARTCQWMRMPERSAFPAYATWAVRAEANLPESHRSAFPSASLAMVVAARIR
jgi:hypothetical protein